MTALELLAAFALIVGGAIGFTNAVEWLGKRLDLGQGAVGALLAAVGTALPESVIPVVALLAGGGAKDQEVAIGSIIGAPFLLGTLAMLLIAVSSHAFAARRDQGAELDAHLPSTRRDLRVCLALLPIGIAVGVTGAPMWLKAVAAVALLAAYGAYVRATVRDGGETEGDGEMDALYLDRGAGDAPRRARVALQLAVSLAAIVGGAELFVGVVETIAAGLGVSTLVLALVLAPLATELPEKANSVLWVRRGKDSLALGNVSGAMVFQATIPMAFGILATDWRLDRFAAGAAAAGFLGAAMALYAIGRRRFGPVPALAWAALFVAFLVLALAG
ncbi:MAG: sodium:calcium antiporter [Solirubrobacteraceae bacterium]